MINPTAVSWKYPTTSFSVHGALEYANIVWHDTALMPTEADMTLAETEYTDYMTNTKPIEDEKAAHKDMLMRQKVESMLTPEFAQVDLAKTRKAIRAIRIK